VVGVQGAEISGEVEARSLNASLARADSEEARAAVIANRTDRSRERLSELRAEKERLDEAYENGSIDRGEYRARLARLGAEIRSLQRVTNATSDAAEDLPADVLERKGVNVTAIRTLRSDAADLSGPEVAAAAKRIAGDDAGREFGGPPANVSAPAGNDTSARGGQNVTADATDGSADRGGNGSAAANGTAGDGGGTPTDGRDAGSGSADGTTDRTAGGGDTTGSNAGDGAATADGSDRAGGNASDPGGSAALRGVGPAGSVGY